MDGWENARKLLGMGYTSSPCIRVYSFFIHYIAISCLALGRAWFCGTACEYIPISASANTGQLKLFYANVMKCLKIYTMISYPTSFSFRLPPTWRTMCLHGNTGVWRCDQFCGPRVRAGATKGGSIVQLGRAAIRHFFLFMSGQVPMQPMRHHVTYVTSSPIGWDLAQPYIKNVMCDNKANSPEIDIHIAKRLRAWQFSIRSYRSKIAENGCSTATRGVTETKMLLFWWHFHSWLNWKVSFYQNDNIFVTVFYNCLSTKRISMIFGENIGALML